MALQVLCYVASFSTRRRRFVYYALVVWSAKGKEGITA